MYDWNPLAAAALTPGLLKHGTEVGINHLQVSLAHAHASVLKAAAQTAWDPLDRRIGFTFGLFSGEKELGTHSTSRDKVSDTTTGTCPHRHRWTLPNFSWGVAVRRDVCRKRFASTATVRRAQKEHGRHFSVVKHFVEDMEIPRAFRNDSGTEYSNSMFVDFCNGLGIRVYRTVYATPKWTRQECDIASF